MLFYIHFSFRSVFCVFMGLYGAASSLSCHRRHNGACEGQEWFVKPVKRRQGQEDDNE